MKKRSNQPKLRFSTALFKGSFVHNPVLTQIIGICPIVAAATSVTDALALSLMLIILLIVNGGLTSLFLKKVPRWLRMCIYTVVGALVTTLCEPLIIAITPNGGAGLGIYLYLLCVNALIVIRCEKFASKTNLTNSIFDALAAGIGYGTVALIVGAVREYINFGSLFAASDALPRVSQTAMPFVALIIIGFLAAIHKWILIRFYPDEVRDTFSMTAVSEKPLKKDPGIFTHKTKNKPKVIRDYKEIRPKAEAEKENQGKGSKDI